MPAEQLNIKIKFDISDLTAGVKKAKTKLGEIATAAKRNIPHINTEGKKAGKSLVDVSEAGSKVKKTLEDIGGTAKANLTNITSESKKITSAFQKMGLVGRAAQAGMNTDGATTSLDEMNDTMKSIAQIDLFGALASQGGRFKRVFSGIKDTIDKYVLLLYEMSNQHKLGAETAKALQKAMTELNVECSQSFEEMKKSIDEVVKKKLKELRTEARAAFKAVVVEATKLIGTIAKIAAAIGGIIISIDAFKISKMAAEIDVAAQRAGFSAQSFQEWTYVLDRAGVEAGELGEIMKTLTESQVDVINGSKDMIAAYEQLGISAAEVASLNQEQLWNRTIAALQNVENATLRNAIAHQIFAEDASKLATVFNMTNQQTAHLIATYNALGATMSADLIKKSNQLQAAVVNLRAAWQGLRNTLA